MIIYIKNLQKKIKLNARAHSESLVHVVMGVHRPDVLYESCIELYISFVPLKKMMEINERVFGKYTPTDVISIPLDTEILIPLTKGGCHDAARRDRGVCFVSPDSPVLPTAPRIFGEIFVCPEVAEQQARQYRTTIARELDLLVIHGLLHLVGYDDTTKAQRVVMRREERRMMYKKIMLNEE